MDAEVLVSLQEAIDALNGLSARYHLYAADLRRFGLDVHKGLDCLGEQCEAHVKKCVKLCFILDGQPVFNSVPRVVPAADVTAMMEDLRTQEQSLLDKTATWTQVCWTANEMTTFHFFQHLAKWHLKGGNGYKGHMAWIRKQLWQISAIGPQDYIASQVTK